LKIPLTYYRTDDVTGIAKNLIGKYLFSNIDNKICGGIITETEAYAGITDKASHAYGNRRTARTEVMFGMGGMSYVYFTYGMHHLFNIVTSVEGNPHAVLIRAIYPTHGLETIVQRRKNINDKKKLCDGPAKLCMALGITLKENNIPLDGNRIWLEDRGIKINDSDITATKRVGVDYAGDDALLPYRFLFTGGIPL
jgi:DNA-3-methyladenine glycosylase